jgi:hypothetical protein
MHGFFIFLIIVGIMFLLAYYIIILAKTFTNDSYSDSLNDIVNTKEEFVKCYLYPGYFWYLCFKRTYDDDYED